MDFERLVRETAQAAQVDDWAVFSFGGDTYALIFLGYYPQEEGRLMVDNYYPAYQRVRKARLTLEEALTSLGTKDVAHGYKGLAVLSGKAKALKNSLTAIDEWGSQFVMEAVCVEGEWAEKAEVPEGLGENLVAALTDKKNPLYAEAWYKLCMANLHPACEGCMRCAKACPQGAIGEKFDSEKCLRQMQSAGYVEDELAAKRMGQRVLGCHTCQKVCPLNDLPTVPQEVDGVELLKAAIEGKRALEPFAESLGKNYLRPAKLVALLLNALANAKDNRWREEALKAREKFDDPRVQKAVDRYLEATPDVEREVKYLLSEEDYRRFALRAEKLGGVTHTQVNHYFDAGEGARARIRVKNGTYQLTIKRHIDAQSLEEHNADIAEEQAERCMREGLDADFVHKLTGLEFAKNAPYQGYLTTQRTTWAEKGLRLELDKSTYLDTVDYEIECEVGSDEEWAKAEAFITANAPSAHKGKSKQARFEARRG